MKVPLTTKKAVTILGMNSGTSADGVDLALIRFGYNRRKPRVSVVDADTVAYPKKVRAEIERILDDDTLTKEETARVDMAYGRYLGKLAAGWIAARKTRVECIASHGQTIGHWPKKDRAMGGRAGATLQIGDGNAIAVGTGLPVISDFRAADVAAGGEGAPLTPFINRLLFADSRKSRILINIGGIANYSYLPTGGAPEKIAGRDCGPGNILSDLTARMLFHKRYDRDGALAAMGEPHPEIVKVVAEADKRRSVSTGREQFDELLVARLLHRARKVKASNHDLMASVVEATARLIKKTISRHLRDKKLDAIYLTGGGRRNITMVERIAYHCRPVEVWPIEALDFDGDYLEAVSFAVLGGCYLYGIPSGLPQITGARHQAVAGKLSLPPGK